MPQAHVDGASLEYAVHGSGEPMLLIMGLATQMIAWPKELIDGLTEAGYQVICFDNRDIGMSSKTEAPPPVRLDVMKALAHERLARAHYLISDLAADSMGLLDHLGIEAAHVIGASMGGMIAQQCAIDYPVRVRSLTSIMSNTGHWRDGRPAASLLPSLRRTFMAPRPETREGAIELALRAWRQISGPHFDEDRVRAVIEEALKRDTDPHGRIRQFLAIQASPERTLGLHGVTAPTLVIHGLLDRLVTPSGGVATAKAVPGSRLLMFPDMAHDLPAHRIPEIVEAILANARRAASAARARSTSATGAA